MNAELYLPDEQPGFPLQDWEYCKGVKTFLVKPPYRIPLMSEIARIPWNGLKVVETFAGGGGSDIGWRMAGYKVVWANEFESNPCETYRLNHPDTILCPRDIKTVTANEILISTGLKRGELDVFSGSPPCQGFSIASQNRLSGKAKTYDNGISQVNEDLFHEYIRLLDGLQPKVFVAENVKGLTIGKAKEHLGSFEMDMFDDQSETILHGLMDCGYVVRWQILNAADYGTPQNRQRAFFIGVRKDLKLEPVFPVKQGFQYSVLDALPHLARGSMMTGKSSMDWRNAGKELSLDKPLQCLAAGAQRATGETQFQVKLTGGNVGSFGNAGNEISIDKPIPTIMVGTKGGCSTGQTQFQIGYGMGYADNKPGNSFARNQKKESSEPIETIQKMPGVAGGAPVHVVDDKQKRKFTIAELKRLGGFPDDFQMTGSYSKQWSVIGNSVCPPQMRAIADCIYQNIFKKI